MRTVGAQTYGGATSLGQDTSLIGATVTFGGTLDGTHALDVSGDATFGGAVGGAAALASLTVAGASALNGGAVTTAGTQTYGGAVTLGGNATLSGSSVAFEATADGAHALAIFGNALFAGTVGGSAPLASLRVTGAVALDGGSVTTAGGQSYGGAATLGADATLAGTSIAFGGTLDGAQALVISGNASFAAPVGGTTALASLGVGGTTALNGGSVTTTRGQSYIGGVTLGADATLSGALIAFGGTVDGAHALAIGGNASFGGAVGGGVALAHLDVSGAAALNDGTVATSGTQTYGGPVTLGADETLTGTTIAFDGTVDGAHALALHGNADFGGAVGGGTALGSLVVSGSTSLHGSLVRTTGAQNYAGAATLGADATLDGAGIAFGGTVDGAHALSLGGSVSIAGAVGGTSPLTSLTASGAAIAFGGPVAVAGALDTSASGSTSFAAGVTAGSVVTGAVALDGGTVTTAAGQSYGNATLGAETVLDAAGAVIFRGTLDGPHGLAIADADGAVTLAGAVGGSTALTHLSAEAATIAFDAPATLTGALDTSAAGATTFGGAVHAGSVVTGAVALDGGSVTTAGGQSYGGPATLGADATLSDTAQGAITFASTVSGPHALVLDDRGGAITLNAGVVGLSTLGSLSATAATLMTETLTVTGAFDTTGVGRTTLESGITAGSVRTGAVALNGQSVNTTGAQSYGAATLGAELALSSGANIDFTSSLDGAFAFNATSGGALTFAGPVGSTAKPGSLHASAASVTFASPVSVGGAIDTSPAGLTTFGSNVAAGSISTGAVVFGGGTVATQGGQSYQAATLAGDTTLTATDAISFGGPVDGAHALDVLVDGGIGANNAITFHGAVGSVAPLASLTARALTHGASIASSVTFDGTVSTTGAQTYAAATLALGGSAYRTSGGSFTQTDATTLTGTNRSVTIETSGGTIGFGGQITGGSNTLALDAGSGSITLAGVTAAGLATNGASLTLDSGTYTFGAGTTVIPGAILNGTLTLGQNTRFAAVTLGSATTINNSGDLVFSAPIVGGTNSLTVDGGNVTFGGITAGNLILNGTAPTLTAGAYDIGAAPYVFPALFAEGSLAFGQPTGFGTMTLLGATSLDSSATSSALTFGSILAASGSAPSLAINAGTGSVSFQGQVGGAGASPVSLSVAGGNIALFHDISTDGGAVAFNGPVTLSNAVTIDTTAQGLAPSGANITFASTIDGASALTLYGGTTGAIAISGAIGSSMPVASLAAAGASANFGGPVAITGALDGSNVALTTFSGGVTAGSVRTAAVALSGGSVTTTNGQSYGAAATVLPGLPSVSGGFGDQGGAAGGPATLGADTVLRDGGGAITFGGSVDGGHSLTIADAGGTVTFTGAVGGTVPLASVTASARTLLFGASVTVAGALDTSAVGATGFGGPVVAESLRTGPAALAGGSIRTSGAQSYGGIDLLADAALTATNGDISFGGSSAYDNGFALDVGAGGSIVVAGVLQNAGSGAITLAAGGGVTIGGATAGGSAALGSAGGTTRITAASLTLQATNGAAQLGYAGGGATGDIVANVTGSITLGGGAITGGYAQIGHGGEGMTGSESGAITLAAGGNVMLAGGSGGFAYAQIGHGGAFSNQAATGTVSDTGAISVSGTVVALAGGSGGGAYAQIGHGGLGAAHDAAIGSGSITYSGRIDVAAAGTLTLSGAGPQAYAQIGNGGFQTNDGATLSGGGSITEMGDITVSVGSTSSDGALQIVGDAYAQIGNGGFAGNVGTTAPGGITQGGDITINVAGDNGTALLGGGNTGSFAYAQIGNGDAGKSGFGNVSGDITITVATLDQHPGTAADASIFNETGHGTVSGTTTLNGVTQFPADFAPADIQASVPTLPVSISSLFAVAHAAGLQSGLAGSGDSLAGSLNQIAPGSGETAGPIEAMSGGFGGSGTGALGQQGGGAGSGGLTQETADLSSGLARSLSGTPGVPRNAGHVLGQNVFVGGLLTVTLASTTARDTPQAVEPADEPYSSWGNEALWGWQ
ncbi:MAG TPA: hypothetical protein VFA22_06705 [Stellaceae bacterium]|nr:hypothetical protein [Stellaceae bacterium]